MADAVAELRAAEREVVREWQWLHDTLNAECKRHRTAKVYESTR
jgi:hypothetical protein